MPLVQAGVLVLPFEESILRMKRVPSNTFLDVVCRDTVSGHDIRRMLALSVIDELVNVEGGRGSWTHYMSNQG